MSRGLLNLGNTCYFNTAVQCLAHVPSLTNRFLRDGPYEGNCAVTREYSVLVRHMWNKRHQGDPIAPRELLREFQTKCPHFSPGYQHDTHEAVLALLDILEESLGLTYMKPLFYGTEEQTVTYPKGTSWGAGTFATLFVRNPEHLVNYSKHQIIEGYEDNDGNRHHVAALETKVTETGHCLLVNFTEKTTVDQVPDTYLGMHLFAFVIHWGMLHGGHYAALLKHKKQWRLVDDDSVRDVDEPDKGTPCSMAWYKKMV